MTEEEKIELKTTIKNLILKSFGWSFSGFSKDSGCDLKRVLGKIDRGKPDLLNLQTYQDKGPANVGVAVHLFLEKYQDYCYENKIEQDIEKAKQIKGEVIAELNMPLEYQKDYSMIVNQNIAYKRFNMDYESISEFKVSFKIEDGEWIPCKWNDPKCVVRAIIDRILKPKDKSLPIIFLDHKTNRVKFETEDEKAKQLRFNAVFYKKFTGEDIEECLLIYDFARLREKTEDVFKISENEKELIAEVEGDMRRYKKSMVSFLKALVDHEDLSREGIIDFISKFFKPIQNHYCGCEYMHFCPIYRNALKNMYVDPDQLDSRTVSNQVEVFDQKRKVSEQHLKQEFKNNGPVDISDSHVFGQTETVSYTVNAPGLLSDLLEDCIKDIDGLDFEKIQAARERIAEIGKELEISKTSLDKALKKNPSMNVLASKHIIPKKGKRWAKVKKNEVGRTRWIR